jgi:hypothetical protein
MLRGSRSRSASGALRPHALARNAHATRQILHQHLFVISRRAVASSAPRQVAGAPSSSGREVFHVWNTLFRSVANVLAQPGRAILAVMVAGSMLGFL